MDKVLDSFLARQLEEATALSHESDIVDIIPALAGAGPPRRYLVQLRCQGLVVQTGGEVVPEDLFAAEVRFPHDYLRRVESALVLAWVHPHNVWHPNIRAPFVCLHLTPGLALVDIAHELYELVTYQKLTPREDDALNPAACAWARRNQDRFPLERRPLRRRAAGGLTPPQGADGGSP